MKEQFFADYLERLEGLQNRLHRDIQRSLPAVRLRETTLGINEGGGELAIG